MPWDEFCELIHATFRLDVGAQVTPDLKLRDLADSLSLLTLLVELEDLDVDVDEAFYQQILTVQDAWNLVQLRDPKP